ncbi:MAG: DUF4167 domain-containing protein [Alphaproteobacteria bacterium]|nr:DUF4167 domain-containing protein [Alphaproteobacteria bacterium]
MRQGGNHQRRQRSGRPNGKRPFNFGPNRSFESNGPGVKLRGTAAQVFDKYLALARDASSSGDRVAAENFYQHAEHYFRLHAAFTARREAERQNGGQPQHQQGQQQHQQGRLQGPGDDDFYGDFDSPEVIEPLHSETPSGDAQLTAAPTEDPDSQGGER